MLQNKYLPKCTRLRSMSKEDANRLNGGETDGKKKFNKKKWREGKYSVRVKVKRWEENRKKNMAMKYHKELKKSGIVVDKKTVGMKKEGGPSQLSIAQLKYKQIQEEKKKRKEERDRINQERHEAIQAYREKKAARFKKLSQKTKKGQPVMRGRIEMLLEKIEKNYANQNS